MKRRDRQGIPTNGDAETRLGKRRTIENVERNTSRVRRCTVLGTQISGRLHCAAHEGGPPPARLQRGGP